MLWAVSTKNTVATLSQQSDTNTLDFYVQEDGKT